MGKRDDRYKDMTITPPETPIGLRAVEQIPDDPGFRITPRMWEEMKMHIREMRRRLAATDEAAAAAAAVEEYHRGAAAAVEKRLVTMEGVALDVRAAKKAAVVLSSLLALMFAGGSTLMLYLVENKINQAMTQHGVIQAVQSVRSLGRSVDTLARENKELSKAVNRIEGKLERESSWQH